MSVSLLHVGMMKTATSYMQSVWQRHPGVCLAQRGTFAVMDALRNAVLQGKLDERVKLELRTDSEYQAGQKVVVSNEGFSAAFLNHPMEDQAKLGAYVGYAANVLKDLLPEVENVLVVVRDPIDWIRSIHVQSIKEGGFQNMGDFLRHHGNFLRHALDLENLLGSYRERFSKVRVLPYELLKRDEAAFWRRIEAEFGIPGPSGAESPENVSSGHLDTLLLARLNRRGSLLLSGLLKSGAYNIPEEKKTITEGYGAHAIWLHRRFVEYASEEEKARMRKLTEGEDTEESFFELPIAKPLLEVLERKFLGTLRSLEWGDADCIEAYARGIERARSN